MFIKLGRVGNGIYVYARGICSTHRVGNKYFNWQQQEDILKDGKNNDLPLGCVSLYPPYAVHSFAQAGVQASLQIF